MLKIHKPNHKLLIISITSILSTGILPGLYGLTYTPELSHAEQVGSNDDRDTRTLADITYMQEITTEICGNSEVNMQFQLKDSRDNKTYWVSRLQDGNCWMTQNLDLDLRTTLTPDNTDIPDNWSAPVTQTGSPYNFTMYGSIIANYNPVVSYDPGEYYYKYPGERNSCGSVTSFETCYQWSRVAGLSKNNTGDERTHYLIGNYYSWAAATAGQATSLTSSTDDEVATQSICPKGWQLPLSDTTNRTDKSFGGLFTSYGWTWEKGSYTNTLNGNTDYDLRLSPLYFLLGGYINDKTLLNIGEYGYYWSSVAHLKADAYYLGFGTSVNPSHTLGRYLGSNIRCVARVGSTTNNISITVKPLLSLEVVDKIEIQKSEQNPSVANLDVSVVSNRNYTVGISAANPSLTSPTTDVTIPSRSTALTKNVNGWGIKLAESSTYTKITSSSKTLYASTAPEAKAIPFNVGISTAPDLPNGEYSTNITITATQN